ncbi:glutathione S-transferase family protein [Pollutimonas harenae]|uniref:Glutathione S-transferase family protein n=1 Tax=Pollutimonas harenae TaxID=657015 RepID=A0A853GS97_9BURK|nr:glutathione S-transferase family protein [Pollutimonas harenae]NYT85978.1 glutathione S-transferase family protein [Pollutimonas harenae]TEA71027.1 glutathione S-transferase family protein [Pollutimonas harenae]
MKLYYLPGACPLASNIAFEWAGQPYELQLVSREALKQPEYLALNPLGAVPTLVDGDFVLTQSAAILEYIAELNPSAKLMPDTPRGRAEVRRWLGLCNADLHRTFGNIFGAQALASTEEFQNELIAKSSAKLRQLFAVADKQLESQDWIAGTRSIADTYLYTLLRWTRAKKVDISDMKNLWAFYDRMEQDPGVQAALKAQGLS